MRSQLLASFTTKKDLEDTIGQKKTADILRYLEE